MRVAVQSQLPRTLLLLGAVVLCFLATGCSAYVWTAAWLNSSSHCQPQSTCPSASVYGVCIDGSSVLCSSTINTATNSLPEYLVPVYDLSCSQTQAVNLLGHMLITYTQTQLLVLNMMPLQTQFFDCHTNETVVIRSNSSAAQNSIKNFIINLAPEVVQPTGIVGVGTAANALHFTAEGPSTWSAMAPPTVPLIIGNWSLPKSPSFAAYWVASAHYSVTVWSPSRNLYNTLSIPIVLGTERINCATSPLIRDRITCAALNRQLRQFTQPTGSRMDLVSQVYTRSSTEWSVPLQEQCQQFYLYTSSSLFDELAPSTAASRLEFPSQLFNCPNPIHNTWANLSAAVQANILKAVVEEQVPSVVPVPSPSPSPMASNLPVPSTPPPATSPPFLNAKIDRTVDIVILAAILFTIMAAIVIKGIGCFYIRQCCRRRLMDQQHSGNIFIKSTRTCWTRICCLGSLNFSHIGEFLHGSGDEIDFSIHPNHHELSAILSSSDEEDGDEKKQKTLPTVSQVDQEFNAPLLDEIRLVLAEDSSSFETRINRQVPYREPNIILEDADAENLETEDIFATNNNTMVPLMQKSKSD